VSRSHPSPVIYLIGTSGHPNYGDEVVTAAWLRYYAEHLPHAQVWLDTPRPGQSAVLFDGLHPGLRCVDTLFHACWNVPGESADEVLAFGPTLLDQPRQIPREVSGLAIVLRADLIHLIGGGYINALWPRHLALLSIARAVGDRTGAYTAITGAGLVPALDDSETLLGEVLSGFDMVDVRDEASASLLAGLVPHATLTADDAFLGLASLPRAKPPQPGVVLCVQDDLQTVGLDVVADYCIRTLDHWAARTEPVLLLECLPPGDQAVRPLLEPHLPDLTTMSFDTLWRDGLPLTRGQRWISTRFHPHLLAAAAGVWGVGLVTGGDYYQNKHASLLALGSGWHVTSDLSTTVDAGTIDTSPFGGSLTVIQRAKRSVADSAAAAAERRVADRS
jgi:polysaccharide pyruvyl transferase WcaK-like protein